MKSSNWQRALHSGDEVTWVDPDGGRCSHTGMIASIEFKGADAAWILFADGYEIECFLHELK